MRSYSDVVSGSGNIIFEVSARYLCGVSCNCLSTFLPNLCSRLTFYLSQGHRTPSQGQSCCAGKFPFNHFSFCDLL